MRRALLISASIPIVVAIACSGSDDVGVGGDNGDDAGGNDGASKKDGNPSSDDGSTPAPTYNDFTNASLWSFFDFSLPLGEADSGRPAGFLGTVFDGKYMYFAPTGNKTTSGTAGTSATYLFLRYDTTAAFDVSASYQGMDLSFLGAGLAYVGGAFDGRFVYLAPYQGTPFMRFDALGAFGDPDASLTLGPTSTIPHFGATFDGNYVYYAPITGGVVQRLDARDGGIGSFDTNVLDGGGLVYQGVIFDGRYAYFSPSSSGVPTDTSHVLRVDTQADFSAPSSWSTFDTHALDPNAQDFTGGVFDGRYVYFAPSSANETTPVDVRFVRYDTTVDFSSPGAWQAYAPAPDAQTTAYHTAGFDGRYVYFLPFISSGPFGLVRYDTQASFGDGSAWSSVDTTTLNPDASGYEGVGFDGRYLYLVPRYGHVGARFDARSPAGLPPGFHGSFL